MSFTSLVHSSGLVSGGFWQEAGQPPAEVPEGAPELPNILTFVSHLFGPQAAHFIHAYQNIIFAWLVMILLGVVAYLASRKSALIPGPLQNLMEMAVEELSNFIIGILGPEGKRYVPFLGTIFLYTLAMNWFGLIPGLFSPTGGPNGVNITAAQAICVFLYVQYTALTRLGFFKYLHHLAGEPKDAIGWSLVPINLPVHLIGELAKPFSLAIRLFGNITGEDILIAAFVGLGIALVAVLKSPVGIPLQVPFIFLALLTSTIQALVFTLLSTVYILLVLPHHEEGEKREH